MRKITVKKIDHRELEVLQYEIECYAFYVAINEIKTDFLNAMITIDSSRILYLKLRSKIESSNITNTLNLTISEASVIQKCCRFEHFEKSRSPYTMNVLTKLNLDIDQKLKSLI